MKPGTKARCVRVSLRTDTRATQELYLKQAGKQPIQLPHLPSFGFLCLRLLNILLGNLPHSLHDALLCILCQQQGRCIITQHVKPAHNCCILALHRLVADAREATAVAGKLKIPRQVPVLTWRSLVLRQKRLMHLDLRMLTAGIRRSCLKPCNGTLYSLRMPSPTNSWQLTCIKYGPPTC